MSSRRRDFLKTVGTGIVAAAAGAVGGDDQKRSRSDVYVGKGSAGDILPKIIEKMGGMGRFVKNGDRVLIKPNMSFANPPEWGTTTSPEAVYTIAKMCIDAGAKRVVICDNTLRDPEACKEKTGIAAAVRGLKGAVVFVPKQESLFVRKSNDKASDLRSTEIVKELEQTTTLISLPTAKSHSAAGVSLGIKGLMGLVRDRGAMHSEMDLHKAIAELLYYIVPTLVVVDATRALLDNGPGGPGKVQELNTFVAGTDPVAVDSYAVTLASWYGKTFEGKQVAHLKHAAALGFGNVESGMINEIAV